MHLFQTIFKLLLVGFGLLFVSYETPLFAQNLASSNPSTTNISGAAGGAANADFDTLIDLIQSTVAYDSWMENGTGEGEISPFAINGVYVDAQGTLRVAENLTSAATLKESTRSVVDRESGDVRQPSKLRFVSLPRLERAIQQHLRDRTPLAAEMLTLAGMQCVEYVIVDEELNDLILAGPAGDWQIGPEKSLVSVDTGRAVLRLDDLLTLWRRPGGGSPFGCSIVPRQEALAQTQDFLRATGSSPLQPGEKNQWLEKLRTTLGSQDVEFFGIAPTSHAALVLLVADYHMKLIGMGLVDSVPGVASYLDTVELDADGNAPAMSVLRWWFAMNHGPVTTDAKRKIFRLPGRGVQVLSENELLAARGERVHTHRSDELNERFANSFTNEFSRICEMYPLYSELENIFDLSLVLAIIEREQLCKRADWQPALFLDVERLPLPTLQIPREVQTVVNHRVINRRQIIAGISGGVWVDSRRTLELLPGGASQQQDDSLISQSAPSDHWWWD